MSFQLKLTLVGLCVKCLGVVTGYKVSSQEGMRPLQLCLGIECNRTPKYKPRNWLRSAIGKAVSFATSEWTHHELLGYPMLRHCPLDLLGDKLNHLKKYLGNTCHRALSGNLSFHFERPIASQALTVDIGWQYLWNLPECPAPRYQLAFATASNYLWTRTLLFIDFC